MPRRNFGPEVKKRSKRLFETLILYATQQIEGSETLAIKVKWKTDRQLSVQSKVRFLTALTQRDNHPTPLSSSEIKEALNRLKDLALLEDNRFATQGSDTWIFTLHLWRPYWELNENLQAFDREWDRRKQQWRQKEVPIPAIPIEQSPLSTPTKPRQDWGEALRISTFYGRSQELAQLHQWVLTDRAQLVTILGMGGLGKTTLATQFADQIQEHFTGVIWRSLRNAPPLEDLLLDLLKFITGNSELILASNPEAQITQCIQQLQHYHCLIVLDNVESILQAKTQSSYYLPGYESYGQWFNALGEATHQSCLILTSREKPRQISLLEGINPKVKTLSLMGLKATEGLEIFTKRGCYGGNDRDWDEIFEFYGGNPLALQIIASSLMEMGDGDIRELMPLLREHRLQFQDVNDLIARQFDRLSETEQQVMYWLAIHRDPVTLPRLTQDIRSETIQAKLPEALRSLSRRCFIERHGKEFSLQPVVLEYMTTRLVTASIQEIQQQRYSKLRKYPLVRAQSRDYVRRSQMQFIMQPIIDALLQAFPSPDRLVDHLRQAIRSLQTQAPRQPGYVAGNLVNLLCQLGVDLRQWDFSELAVWQAHLVDRDLQNVNFRRSDLSGSVFKETIGITLSIDFSTDGKKAVTSHEDGTVRVWAAADGQKLLTLTGHTNWVWQAKFSPDGRWIASCSNDRTIRLWDAATGQALRSLQGHQGWVWSIAFSSDGQWLVSGSDDGTVRLWDLHTASCIRILSGHRSDVFSVAVSPSGHQIASASQDGTIVVWDAATGTMLQTLRGHTEAVYCVRFTQDGQSIVSGSGDRTIKVWNWSIGQCLQTLQGHQSNVLTLAFDPQEKILVSSGRDETIKLWDLHDGRCLQTLRGHRARVSMVTVSPDGEWIASVGHDRTIRIWQTQTGYCLRVFQGFSRGIRSLRFSPDGQWLASGTEDNRVQCWNLTTQTGDRLLEGHQSMVWAVRFSPDSQHLISASDDKTIRLWDLATGQQTGIFPEQTQPIFALDVSPDGHRLAIAGATGQIQLWDISTQRLISVLQGHENRIWSIAFRSDGQQLLSTSHDRSLRLWEVSTGACVRILRGHESVVTTADYSPDGQWIASGADNGEVRLWNAATGDCVQVLRGHQAMVPSVVFTPDSQQILSVSADRTLRVWETATGHCLHTIVAHASSLHSIALSPTGSIVATGSQDGTVKLWDRHSWDCIGQFSATQPYEGMDISGVTGLTPAEIESLRTLGAMSP